MNSDEMSDEGVNLPPAFGRDERMPSTGDQVRPPPARFVVPVGWVTAKNESTPRTGSYVPLTQ